MRRPLEVNVAGRPAPLSRGTVIRAVESVLRPEGQEAVISIGFLGREKMRRLNRRWTGRDQVTDVLAFPLRDPGGKLVGDVYICRFQAVRQAAALGIPIREELLRLIVHGVLHVLGYDHPEGANRVRSPMWKRQEQLVRRLR